MSRLKKIFSLLLTTIMVISLVQVSLVVQGEETFSTDMKVAAGRMHTLVLRGDGTVWACGLNGGGQLGDGTTTDRNKLVQVAGLENIKEIAAGYQHSLALDKDGSVWAWGSNVYNSLIDIKGDVTTPRKIESLSGITAISAGQNFSLALDSEGKVYSWGNNYHGNLGNGVIPTSGSSAQTTPQKIESLSGITAISAKNAHGLALDRDGNVWSWGENNFGQLGNGTTGTSYSDNSKDSATPAKISDLSGKDITAISAGDYFNLALSSTGEVYGWGDNSYGEVGNGVAIGKYPSLGDNIETSPVKVNVLTGIKEIAAGGYVGLAIDYTGNVYAWGNNNYRQLGVDEALTRSTPEKVSSLKVKISTIQAFYHNIAIDENGKLWSWGNGQYGRLGIGSSETRNPTPTLLQTATASANNNQPTAGDDNTITFTVKDAFGDMDTSFGGDRNITLSGAKEAPNNTYGSFNGTDLGANSAGDGQTIAVNFTNGKAEAKLILNKAEEQTINFSIDGVANPKTNSLTITPTAASANRMEITTNVEAPESNGGEFSIQPIVTLKDAFGNICINDSTTAVTVSKKDPGDWNLTTTETTTKTLTADQGIVTFTGLGAANDKEVTDAQLSFTAADISEVLSAKVTLPKPEPACTAKAQANKKNPMAGEANTITFTVQDALKNVDTSFNGEKNITISGVQKAPNATYGSFNGTDLDETSTGAGQTIEVNFTVGKAEAELKLNEAEEQTINFSIDGVKVPETDSLTIIPTAASPHMVLTTDIEAPESNGGEFKTQPIITLKDSFGNICVNDNTTEVTVSKKDGGDWSLTGTKIVTADKGVVTFTGLGAANDKGITGAKLSFTAESIEEVISGEVTLPKPTPAYITKAQASKDRPTAGEANTITFTVNDALENVDTSFNGEKNITISGVQKAPNATYGSFNGIDLDETSTEAGQTIVVDFADGKAAVDFKLNKSVQQTINFSVGGVASPRANSITITPTAASADEMEVTTDIKAPTSNGGKFSTQPIVILKDTFENVCENDNTTEITVFKKDTGDWNLTGMTKVKANDGVVTFTDLGVENDGKVEGAQLLFKAKDLGEIVSEKLTLMPPGAPNAPSIQSILPGDSHIVITWNMLPDVSRYNLYQSTTSNSYTTPIANIKTTVTDAVYSYDVKGLDNGRKYYFTVTAINGGGESDYAKEVSAAPQVLAPGTPVLYEAIGKDKRVDIAWKEVGGSTGYKVYSGTESGNYTTPVDTVAGSVYNCSVDGLTNGTTYYFVVKAINPGGESGYSNELSSIPVSVPDAPTNVTALAGDSQAAVNFSTPSHNGGSKITNYIITSTPGDIQIKTTNTSGVITGLQNDTTYRFTVQAENTVGKSTGAVSNEVTPTASTNDDDDSDNDSRGGSSGGGSSPSTSRDKDSAKEAVQSISNTVNSTVEVLETVTSKEEKQKIIDSVTDIVKEASKAMDVMEQDEAVTETKNVIKSVKEVIKAVDNDKEMTESIKKQVVAMAQKAVEKAAAIPSEIDVKNGVLKANIVDLKDTKEKMKKAVDAAKEMQEELKDIASKEDISKIKAVVSIDVSTDKEVKAVSIVIPGTVIEEMQTKQVEYMKVKLNDLEFRINKDSFGDIKATDTLTLEAKKIDEPKATSMDQAEKLKNAPVYEITAMNNKKKIEAFNKPVEVIFFLPDVKAKDIPKLTAMLYDEITKTWTLVGGRYDEKTQKLIVKRPYFSKYTIAKSNKAFTDVRGHWAEKEMNALLAKGVLDDTKRFESKKEMTREEFSAWIVRAYSLMPVDKVIFDDVDKTNPYYKEIAAAYKAGIVNGRSEAKFDPKATITRQEIAVMIARALESYNNISVKQDKLGFPDEASIASWAKSSVLTVEKSQVFGGYEDGTFRPENNMTKAEGAAVIYRLYNMD